MVVVVVVVVVVVFVVIVAAAVAVVVLVSCTQAHRAMLDRKAQYNGMDEIAHIYKRIINI